MEPTKRKRKLAAIMFTDLVGFSSLSNKNEKRALSLLDEHRNLLRAEFAKFNGNEIKTIGDGFLVQFPNSLDSINSAIAIQKSLDLYNITKDLDEQINLRIGLHLGDVEESDGDMCGDGVNIASRIEPFAESGGICISRQVYDQIKNKIQFDIESLGNKSLKNISSPVELYSVSLPWNMNSYKKVGDRKVENSIAVLPFINMSSDEENEYFCDGLTEELLNVLAKQKDLKVTSRTSVFSYKGKDVSMRKIADELGVENILEGSVRKAGNRLRITAQLIRSADDVHLWSDTYNRTLDDIFDLQDEMASTLLSELLNRIMKVQPGDDKKAARNKDAYKLYLEAIGLWNHRTLDSYDKAISLLEKAIKIDDKFSLAYCLLADCHIMHGDQGSLKDEKGHKLKAEKYIKIAEAFGGSSAEFYTAKANLLDYNQINKKIEFLQTAIKINPNYATAHHRLSISLGMKGEQREALKAIEHAVSLDPNSAIILRAAAAEFKRADQYEKALKLSNKLKSDFPDFWSTETTLSIAHCYICLLEWNQAKTIYDKFIENDFLKMNNIPKKFNTFIEFYLIINEKEKASELISFLKNKITIEEPFEYAWRGMAYAKMNDHKSALKDFDESIKRFGAREKLWVKLERANSLVKLNDKSVLNDLEEIYKEIQDRMEDEADGFGFYDSLLIDTKMLEGEYYVKNLDLENTYLAINNIRNTKLKVEPKENLLGLSLLYQLLNDNDKAYKYFDEVVDDWGISKVIRLIPHFIYGSATKNLRNDPRYIDLLKQCKLYEFWKDSPEIKRLD